MGHALRLLFIEPALPASTTPLLDAITRRMCAAFRNSRRSEYAFGGVHTCCCEAISSCTDHILPRGEVTNSLCVHYLAHHRDEVPRRDLALVERLDAGEAEPDERELQGPQFILARKLKYIQRSLGPARLRRWTAWGLDAERLAIGLQGGTVRSPESVRETRRDAADLMTVLLSVPLEAMDHFREAVLTCYPSPEAWGTVALCVTGWRRDAWEQPLEQILRLPEEIVEDRYKRFVQMTLNGCVRNQVD